MSDLLKAAADSPLLLAFLVILGGGVWAVEKLGGVNGPISRAVRAWQNRELRKLETERLVDDRRRELRDARIADLESEIAWLREQLDQRPRPTRTTHPVLPHPRREPATVPIPSRNSARAHAPGR